MRTRVLLRLLSFLVAALITLALFPGAAGADGGWTMLAEDGIGDPSYAQLIPAVEYKGDIFISASAWGAPAPPKIWAYDGKSLKINNDDGFGDPNNAMAFAMTVFNGRLYAGTANWTSGSQLWAYDGTSWTKVAGDGFGNPANLMSFPMGVVKDKLVVGVMNDTTGCELYTYDGTKMVKVAGNGLGNPNNTELTAKSTGNGSQILVTTGNTTNGSEVFSFDGTTLKKIADGGIDDPENYDCKVISYNPLEDAFYLGFINDVSGGSVWKYKGGEFSQFGTDGLGDVKNQGFYPVMAGGTMYFPSGWSSEEAPVPGAVGKIFKKTGENTATAVVDDGFGNSNNMECLALASYNGYLYCGTINPAEGGQLWRGVVPPTLLKVDPVLSFPAGSSGVPAGSNVVLTGRDFHETRGTGKVLINGIEAKVLSWSDASITAEVPGAATSGQVQVVTSGGASNSLELDISLPDTWYFAEGTTRDNATDGSFDTYLCIQNPGDSSVEVDVAFLVDGTDIDVPTINMPPDSRATVNARDFLGDDVDAAAVVSAAGPIVVERPMYFNYRNKWTGGHVVMGVPNPRETWYFAEGTTRDNATDGSYEEWLTMLNPGDTDADVTVTYMPSAGEPVTSEMVVGSRSRATVDVNMEVGSGRDVSVMVESSEPLVAERSMYFEYRSMWTGGHAISGVPEPAGEFYFAEGTTRNNEFDGSFQEWISIQNPGDEDAAVTITYMTASAGTSTQEIAVPAGSRRTVDVAGFLGEGIDCSAKVTSDRPIVAERPIYFNYRSMWDGGHNVAGCTAPKRNWYFAEGTTRDNAQDGVFHEYICIQNPGAEEVTVSVDYLFGDTGKGLEELKVAPGSRSTIDVASKVGVNKDIAGIMVAADGNIVCERAMYFNYHNKWSGGHCSTGYGL